MASPPCSCKSSSVWDHTSPPGSSSPSSGVPWWRPAVRRSKAWSRSTKQPFLAGPKTGRERERSAITGGRSAQGKLLIAGAVEVEDRRLGCLSRRQGHQTRTSCRRPDGRPHRAPLDPSRVRQLQDMGAWRLSRPAPQEFPDYLDEFVFRYNRRGNRHAGFARLLAISLGHKPVTYNRLIAPDAQA